MLGFDHFYNQEQPFHICSMRKSLKHSLEYSVTLENANKTIKWAI